MRFLHLSDLHLGKRVCEFSMLDDQRYILEQILSLLDKTPVDGVLLAGDLYDKPVPPAEAVRLLDWFPHPAGRTQAASVRHQRQPRLRRPHRLRLCPAAKQPGVRQPGVLRCAGAHPPHRRIRHAGRVPSALPQARHGAACLAGRACGELQRCPCLRAAPLPAGPGPPQRAGGPPVRGRCCLLRERGSLGGRCGQRGYQPVRCL